MRFAILSLVTAGALALSAGSADARPPYRGGHSYHNHYGSYYRPYYASYYRPYYGVSFYSSYSYPTYYYPTYYSDCGVYLGISGGVAGSGVPTVTLGTTNFARPPAGAQPMAQPIPLSGDGTFPYDGGPAIPVPLPKADPQVIPPASPSATATDLPISSKPKGTTTPYKYKAYGEK